MTQPLDVLTTPGPARSAAVTAATASLRTSIGVCGDRARAAATQAIDAAVAAAKAQEAKP
jgi:hypothetical protein